MRREAVTEASFCNTIPGEFDQDSRKEKEKKGGGVSSDRRKLPLSAEHCACLQ